MPVYEYQCPKCSQVIELIRSMCSADESVNCPNCGSGQSQRILSTVNAGTSSAGGEQSAPGGGFCPCGKNQGGCGS